ncbi:MAG: peptidase, partial [Caulobacter sp.]|nr:peptidase [Caulobacter sp.]
LGLGCALAAGVSTLALAAEPIDVQRLSDITRALSSDAFEGRAPGSPGEARTVAYLIERFKALGLEPGGEAGGWTQAVPVVRFQVKAATIGLTVGGETRPLVQTRDVMIRTRQPRASVSVDAAPLVFVGYGVTAPERGWDDFKGVDLKGKIAVFLINDPDFEAQPGEPVAGQFGGKAATYYARWTYKYEEAARRGAAGAIIVHETAGAAYGWSTVTASNGEVFDIARADPAKDSAPIEGWMQRDVAVDLFRRSGLDFEQLKAQARTAAFRPVALKATLSAKLDMAVEPLKSLNVLAKIPGAARPDESVMYGAHWDAFGLGAPDAKGDRVRHGALDDGIGVAGLLEIARAFKAGPAPARSVVFGVWTGEERGLLGSGWYVTHPLYSLAKTAANYTIDVLQPLGPSRDVVLVGYGQNTLEDDLAKAAAGQSRTVTPDAHPERGLFYRADHFSLAREGVPTLLLMSLGGGPDLVEGGRAAGDRWISDYTARCYHQTCDAWSPDWDLRGAAQDIGLIYQMGRDLADSDRWPSWKAGSEFGPVRAKSAAARR